MAHSVLILAHSQFRIDNQYDIERNPSDFPTSVRFSAPLSLSFLDGVTLAGSVDEAQEDEADTWTFNLTATTADLSNLGVAKKGLGSDQ